MITNPLLYLDNVDGEELNVVLDYIYKGEVQIYQENLDNFLNIATKLKLEGLLSTGDTLTDDDPKEERSLEEAPDVLEDDIQANNKNFTNVKPREYKPRMRTVPDNKPFELAVNCETPESQQAEIEARFQEVILKEGQTFTCTCLLYTSPSPRDKRQSRMPSSA